MIKLLVTLILIFSVVYCDENTIKKIHNQIKVEIKNSDNPQGWLFNCQSELEDSPPGCTLSDMYAQNETVPQFCARKCAVGANGVQIAFAQPIEFEVYEMSDKYSRHATCKLNWEDGLFLIGYDLDIHYFWVDHPTEPFVKVISCLAKPITSTTPMQNTDQFIETRNLYMDRRFNYLLGLLVMLLMILTAGLCCCAFTCCVTCLCVRACSNNKPKRPINKNKKQEITFQAPPQQIPNNYMPYFIVNPYNNNNNNNSFQMVPIKTESV